MPLSSKSPQALSTKSHSFLRKSTDASPSRTTSPSVPSEVRTSQSTVSLNPRYNESNHPEEDDVISSLGTEVLVVLEGLSSVLFRKNE